MNFAQSMEKLTLPMLNRNSCLLRMYYSSPLRGTSCHRNSQYWITAYVRGSNSSFMFRRIII